MKILLAGGAGYIGTHTAVCLMDAGHDVVIIDNLCNSSYKAVQRTEQICGKSIDFYEADVRDKNSVMRVLREHEIDCVIHFAGLKAVGESVEKPLMYYRNNIDTTLTLLECMQDAGVDKIVFSSSATVYGEKNPVPYLESMPRGECTNPYGRTKAMMEEILEDAVKASDMATGRTDVADQVDALDSSERASEASNLSRASGLSVVLLRYFNPVGAHPSGLIGEDPQGIPNNLMPFVAQVAVGRRSKLSVFGGDYDTPDGTCRRDFIHVMDLAAGHVAAVEYMAGNRSADSCDDGGCGNNRNVGDQSSYSDRGGHCSVFNLGTGSPSSVLELVEAFEKASGVQIPYEIAMRREGDIQDSWADASKARKVLGWQTKLTLEDACRDTWNWQQKNPDGYE